MFEHFTFGAHAQSISQLDFAPSPTDTSFPSPLSPPPTSYFEQHPQHQSQINEIVHKLSQQSIRHDDHDERLWQLPSPVSPSIGDDLDQEMELPSIATRITDYYSEPNTPIFPPARGGNVACRRLQRQVNVQLQSCSNHIRDINALVEDMIENSSQCRLHKSSSRPSLPSSPPSRSRTNEPFPGLEVDPNEVFEEREISPIEDEGFHETNDDEWELEQEMTLRRASTPRGIRKIGAVRFRASIDSLVTARPKVKRLPRMRSRKAPPPIEES